MQTFFKKLKSKLHEIMNPPSSMERYLAGAVDAVDLENRMNNWMRHHQGLESNWLRHHTNGKEQWQWR